MKSLMNWLLVLHLFLIAMNKASPMESEKFSPKEVVQRESTTQRKEVEVTVLTVVSLTTFPGIVKKRKNLKAQRITKLCT